MISVCALCMQHIKSERYSVNGGGRAARVKRKRPSPRFPAFHSVGKKDVNVEYKKAIGGGVYPECRKEGIAEIGINKEENHMKKTLIKFSVQMLSVCLMLAVLVSGSALAEGKIQKIGTLTLLNLPEGDFAAIQKLRMQSVLLMLDPYGEEPENEGKTADDPEIVYFNSLNEMLMALDSGAIQAAELSRDVAAYIAARHDSLQILRDFGSKEDEESSLLEAFLLETLFSYDYSFMGTQENEDLVTAMEAAAESMMEDGTMDELVEQYIDGAISGGDPEVAAPEQTEGWETVRVVVTGDMPPIDYITAGGGPTGFNAALLAEVGRRIEKNIQMIPADAGARALMLTSGEADIAFWTRSCDGYIYLTEEGVGPENWEELFDIETEEDRKMAELVAEKLVPLLDMEMYSSMDIPEGLVISSPYYGSVSVLLVKKDFLQ